jgi:uncharacterized protein YgiM (DUF1202 family)
MRCPECTERNSVAARSCDACGYKFKRKPVPVTAWIALGAVAVVLTCWGVASAVVPSLTDPSKSLARVAKSFLNGPSNPEHATRLKQDFDNSVREFLIANGKDPSPELVKKLQTTLASSAFEVHSFELPRGLKVIEIDTILQAADFLIMNSAAGTKVFPLKEFEVFDSAQIINDQARNDLVLIGHSAGQGARRPQVKVFALLPDDIQDETSKAVPPIVGEGTASFAANHKDVIADLSLFSIGVAQHLFKPLQPSIGRGEEERIRVTLTWKDGRYTASQSNGKGALSALYAVARCMQAPADPDRFADALSSKAVQFIKSSQIKLDSPNFVVGQTETPSKQRRTPTVSRLLNGPPGNSFRVELQKSGDGADAHVVASNIKRTDETIAVAPPIKTPSAVTPSAVTPTATPTPTQTPTVAQTQPLTPVQVATMDPGFNHHQAQIVEKKTSTKKEPTKNNISIEDRIINSSKNSTLIQSSKDDNVKKTTVKEAVKETAKAPEQTPAAESKKVEIVETKAKAVKYPVDQEISPPVEKTADSNINLRRGPSNGYRTLAHLKPGAKIELIGKKNGWYKVRSAGTEGFIMSSSIDKKSATPTNKPETSTSKSESTAASKSPSTKTARSTAPVKETPSVKATAPAKTAASEKATAPVKSTTSSKTASSTSNKSSTPAPVKETSEPMQKGLTTGTLNRNRTIRDENHNPIGVATKGAKVVVLTGLKNGKYKVQLPSGKTGYVDKDTVDVVNDAPQFVP